MRRYLFITLLAFTFPQIIFAAPAYLGPPETAPTTTPRATPAPTTTPAPSIAPNPSPTTNPSPTSILRSDLNRDGRVNALDYAIFLPLYGRTGNPGFHLADINQNGRIDALDYNVIVTEYGRVGTPIPTPTSIPTPTPTITPQPSPSTSPIPTPPPAEPQGSVTSYDCQSSDPPIIFLSVPNPPSGSPNQSFTTTLEIANCSSQTWAAGATGATGFKLGFVSPQGNSLFGPGRHSFPATVNPGQKISLNLSLHLPSTNGSFVYQPAIVEEGVKWHNPPAIPRLVTVGPVTLCPAIPNTGADSRTAIQSCLDQASPGSIVELQPGTYILEDQLLITKSLTLATAGTAGNQQTCGTAGAPPCAILQAHSAFPRTKNPNWTLPGGWGGLLRAFNVNDVTIHHLVFEGNRANRPAIGNTICVNGEDATKFFGFNATLVGARHRIFYNQTLNAACGTGLYIDSAEGVVAHNQALNNGVYSYAYADGFTIPGIANGYIMNNTAYNNSDVNLIIASAKNAGVFFNDTGNNTPYSVKKPTLASLMLDNFNQVALADSTNVEIAYNRVNCTPGTCGVGIQLGGSTWYGSGSVRVSGGGRIHHNTVAGSRQDINASGIGTASSPIYLEKNTIAPHDRYDSQCGFPTSYINLGPDTNVVHDLGTAYTSNDYSKGFCIAAMMATYP